MSAVKIKQNTVTLTGKVIRKRVAPRSKSDRVGVVLENEDGRWYVLRRAGGNPFRDRALDQLVGKMITATGFVSGRSFIMSDWVKAGTREKQTTSETLPKQRAYSEKASRPFKRPEKG